MPQRRTLAQRVKADENATSRHLRQPSNAGGAASRFTAKEVGVAAVNQVRPALGEVTTTAVNRKVGVTIFFFAYQLSLTLTRLQDIGSKIASGKDKEEVGLKRGRSNSTTVAQRVPLGPGRGQVAPPVANSVHARVSVAARRIPVQTTKRISKPIPEPVVLPEVDELLDDHVHEMDVEDNAMITERDAETEASLLNNEEEVEAMVGVEDSEEEEEVEQVAQPIESKPARVWPNVSTDRAHRYQKEVQAIRESFEDEVDMYDTTMVSEYAEEIFEYMCDLEVCSIFFGPSRIVLIELVF